MIALGILDRSSPLPLHEQLARGMRAAIVEGRWGAGEVVPSTRALAVDLGVARGTVVTAYEILAGEGYLLTRGGGRTTVAPRAWHPVPVEPALVTSVPAASARVVDLQPGRPSTRGVADAGWRSAWRRASAVDPAADVDDEAGLPALRAEIARHLSRTRGVDVDPAEVIVTAGTSDALLLTLLALTPRAGGRLRVGVENPGYPRVRMVLARLGMEAVPVPVRPDEGLDLTALEAHGDLDAIIVTPHHHYPLGTRLDAAGRARLLAWAARTGAVVVEDDYDSEFPHGRAPLPPLRMLDPARVVLVGSLSKVLSPALRCGWVIASGDLRDRVVAARADLDSPVSLVEQEALALYLADGALARHTARRRREYRHRRRLLVEAFVGVPGVQLTAMEGGLHAVVLVPGAEERALEEALAARGILVSGLSRYAVPGAPTDLPAGLVIGYAEPPVPALVEAVEAIVDEVAAMAQRRGVRGR